MDGDFRLDMNEVMKNIETAEVICIYFPILRKAFVIDRRTNGEDEPMVKLAPMVDSIEDRFRSIRRMRPKYPRPESITVLPWPKYVDSLVRLGIWDRIVEKFINSGHKKAVAECQTTLETLRKLEKQELAAVVMGQDYDTIWESQRKPRL